ncbi:MAG: ribonuclease III [Polyangiales bacterium]|nr:ribonuclease III [Myxococcales bacterium]
MSKDLDGFERALGYDFRERALLEEALTHRSFANEARDAAVRDNERLEFLGDSVLGMIVSELLSDAFPSADEGELTRRRADIVCEASLAEVARELAIGEALRIGRGEEQTGGRSKPRLLACALEAVIGGAYRDTGFDACVGIVRRLFGDRLAGATPGSDDHKSRLQELVQSRGGSPPTYRVLGHRGPDHARVYEVHVRAGQGVEGTGEGRSKIEAEQAAARMALDALEARAGDGVERGT